MVVSRTVLSERSPFFTQVPKVFQSNTQRTYIEGRNIPYLNCLRKPTLKGKNNSTHLIQWMKEDFYCLLFPLEVSTVLFGVNMYYFTEKLVYKDLTANASHFVVFLIPFVRRKYIYFTLLRWVLFLSAYQLCKYNVLNHVHDVSNITQCNAVVTKS